MTDLSQQLMVSNGNVTGLVDRLVADDMALRQNEETDRRAFRISLTEAGSAQMAGMLEQHHSWINEIFRAIPEHDLARGIAIMLDLRRKEGAGSVSPLVRVSLPAEPDQQVFRPYL